MSTNHTRTPEGREQFALLIGRLDRILSEMIALAQSNLLDDPDKQTLKHHAEDMIGAGNKILETVMMNEVLDQ